MAELEIEVKFFPDPQVHEEERLRGIARWLVREYLASQGCKELINEDEFQTPLLEEVLGERKCPRASLSLGQI